MKKLTVLLLFGLLGIAACERKEGPVEETGESIDETLGGEDKSGAEDLGEDVEEALPDRKE